MINWDDERLAKTEAYKRRNKEWSSLFWDYTEWEECIEEAKEEVRNKK